MAKTVQWSVHITVRHVDTQTDCALVRQDGWVQIALQVIIGNMISLK